ncbi:MAG TPA: DUF2141 domain-containing protein, partial [Rhizomicrobium sp.]|nr:DUF2141 domain-containing protein [Rhizomicrobium sp.]
MLRSLLACVAAFALTPACFAAALATLTIKVEKVSPRGGDLRVALYNEQNYSVDNAEPVTGAIVPAHTGETIVTLPPVKPGFYAVKMFQDFNRNGQFDMNWIGWPLEKYGFSNDASPTIEEPSFDATKFELRPGANTI